MLLFREVWRKGKKKKKSNLCDLQILSSAKQLLAQNNAEMEEDLRDGWMTG